jgi:hypothetical protein
VSDDQVADMRKRDSLVSVALALAAAALLFIAWRRTDDPSPLLGGVGFLVVSPLWYRAPINFRKAFSSPIFSGTTYPATFGPLESVLSLVGYLTIAAAVLMWFYRSVVA